MFHIESSSEWEDKILLFGGSSASDKISWIFRIFLDSKVTLAISLVNKPSSNISWTLEISIEIKLFQKSDLSKVKMNLDGIIFSAKPEKVSLIRKLEFNFLSDLMFLMIKGKFVIDCPLECCNCFCF